MKYNHWVEEQKKQTKELRSSLQAHVSDIELLMLVEIGINHYDELFQIKAVAANSDVLYLMSGMWKTATERFFLWIGGFRPSELLKCVRRGQKLRSVGEIQSGLRRSRRSTRPRINYRQYELSDTDPESEKPGKSDEISDASNDMELSAASQDSNNHEENGEKMLKGEETRKDSPNEIVEKEESRLAEKMYESSRQGEGVKKRQVLDLNELAPDAPGTGFEDGSNATLKDEDIGKF